MRPTVDRQLGRRGVALLDEIFRGALKVVETVLHVVLAACVMPGLPILAAPADIGHHGNTKMLHKEGVDEIERGR